jgi:hypothetical protein
LGAARSLASLFYFYIVFAAVGRWCVGACICKKTPSAFEQELQENTFPSEKTMKKSNTQEKNIYLRAQMGFPILRDRGSTWLDGDVAQFLGGFGALFFVRAEQGFQKWDKNWTEIW